MSEPTPITTVRQWFRVLRATQWVKDSQFHWWMEQIAPVRERIEVTTYPGFSTQTLWHDMPMSQEAYDQYVYAHHRLATTHSQDTMAFWLKVRREYQFAKLQTLVRSTAAIYGIDQ